MPTSAARKVSRSWRRAACVSASSSARDRLAVDRAEEHGDLLRRLLDRGRDDVDGVLAGELEDVLAEIGLDGVTPTASRAALSPISSVAIDFDLAASFAPGPRADVGDVGVRVLGRPREDDVAAARLERGA